jgi:hypothetical protein
MIVYSAYFVSNSESKERILLKAKVSVRKNWYGLALVMMKAMERV